MSRDESTAAPGATEEAAEDHGEDLDLAAGRSGGDAIRPGQRATSFGSSLKRLLRSMLVDKWWLFGSLTIGAVSVLLMTLGPRLLGRATDIIFTGVVSRDLPAEVTKEQAIANLRAQGQDQIADMMSGMVVTPGVGIDFPALRDWLLLAAALYVAAALFQLVEGWLLNKVIYRTVYRLRRDVEAKVHSLPLTYFDRTSRGETLSRVTNDIDNLTQSMQNTISGVVHSLLTVLGVLLMMILLSPTLTLVALVVIPIVGGLSVLIGRKSQKLYQQQWDATGRVNASVEEAYSGHELVKVFGRSAAVSEAFERENDQMFRASFGAQFLGSTIMPVMQFVGNLSYVAIAVVGGLRVANGTLTLGSVQAFIQYSRQFTQPLAQIASMVNMLQSGVASAERVFDLLDEEEQDPETEVSGAAATITEGRVEFDHVAFSYDPAKPLIEDLSLTAEPGHTVAIVGPTGAGKTTLVNLVQRFYEIDDGAIRIDGIDIRDLSRAQLRHRTGMVLQDTWLFEGTIRENIRYGRLDATDEEVAAAARATYVDRFVQHLPDGYDTVLDTEGSSVSAGQKQLLTIARAFLAQPSLLILDEATSSVDTRTELLVQQAMNALRKNRTSFVIAHRLSTIRDADLILVMEDGRIVEQGGHDDLIEADGPYARLYRSQFEGATQDWDGEPDPVTGQIPSVS